MFCRSTLIIACCVSFSALADIRPGDSSLTGYDIEQKQDQMQTGYKGETREMTLTLINAQGQESGRKLAFEGSEQRERREKTLIHFEYPPDVKGTALLTHERGAEDDDQWLYLPS